MASEIPQPFGDYYREIYAKGMFASERPTMPIAWAELERAAREQLDDRAVAYVFGGAGAEDTMHENLEAFRRRRIVPRVLRDISSRDLSTTLLGTELSAPVMLAPVGVQKVLHPDGELASARAAAKLGLGYVASTAASSSMEDIAEAGGAGAPRWYQLYWPNDTELAESLVRRAEAASYSAIVLTVDNSIVGWKPRDLQQAYLPFLEGIGIEQYLSDPVFRAALEKPPEEDIGAAVGHFLGVFMNPALSWDRLEWLRDATDLPIVIKGILHPDDAALAREHGAAGVVVSNHGGRQVDGAISSLDALPAVADEVGDELAVMLDSGIRSGADAVKALALGADAVMVGRPYLWGLALEGEQGVETVMRCILAELDLTLALSGHTDPAQLEPSLLRSSADA